MQSIMAAIPAVFTPGRATRSSPRNSLGPNSTVATQESPRLKKNTPGSNRRRSFAKKLTDDQGTTPQSQGRDDSSLHAVSEETGASLQLEQDDMMPLSASTPRVRPSPGSATRGSATRSSKRSAAKATASPSGTPANAVRAGRISEILNRKDIGVPDTEEDAGGEEYGFKRFVGYRWAGNSIEIQVEWDTGETTWEPEINLHEDVPDTLFQYWREQGGRPSNPVDPEMYEVFAIRKHNGNRTKLMVEWVGYEPSEATWVSRKGVEETAKDIVDAYFESVKTTRGRGKKKA
ncbi:hypothetical protein TGAM01_v208049 [Trichoderma gamsii]|uniref:Chromo domain-containing protein n=1 Tax=Trichoderma gamsii TaxID=398673 RepID=A0A2P4ZFH4_9HYPO|nr:hypothetical protein TGAM01_v208049 [Trichoderma gamsii]PON23044.1 hypothetical protein TGAM01_v208049 [Trichoderma gamsii]